ncbi:MAG TPA: ATP-dependent Clp protease adaptor ClpS [Anaeromyxobacteraceae bacterium]|nr:ATP-dependent Clp protease adaptor ClpS [Anaeromyxobacteraceae bacterium]
MVERTRVRGNSVIATPRAKGARRLARPPFFKVLLHNDDYTTMEFVVEVLQTIFHHDRTRAERIMRHVHERGVGVAGTYTMEIAETKAERVVALARAAEFPLLCTVEPE